MLATRLGRAMELEDALMFVRRACASERVRSGSRSSSFCVQSYECSASPIPLFETSISKHSITPEHLLAKIHISTISSVCRPNLPHRRQTLPR